MKITAITAQVKNPNRVNVIVDGVYRFSLDLFQVSELGLRVGKEYTETELDKLLEESIFGKLYVRALEYTMLRPHSAKEIRDYLWKKTQPKQVQVKTAQGYSWKKQEGVSQDIADRVYERLQQKGYIDDEKFARFWVENRHQRKGASRRKLSAELATKGVSSAIIEGALSEGARSEEDEIKKMIAKYKKRYDDPAKFMAFLARQGFSYQTIKEALDQKQEQ